MLLEVRRDTKRPFLVVTVILGFLSIFKKSQASSNFEALNSACLSRQGRDVRPPVQIKAPYLFASGQGIALHAMQGNRASSLGEREVSWFFSSCSRNLGYILELRQG